MARISRVLALIFLNLIGSLVPVVTATAVTTVATATLMVATADQAIACVDGVNCDQPTAVSRGQEVPVWHVVSCLVGPENGPYQAIACNDPRAVHISPRGMEAVCFLGSDGKVHWDLPGIVYEGRPFRNLRQGGVWQPLWELTEAEKARLGIQ